MKKIYGRILVNFLLTGIGVALAVWLFPKIVRFFLPFVIAFIISMIANPVVRFLEKRIKIVRKHGSAITIIVALAIVVGLLYLLLSVLVRESINLLKDLPMLAEQMFELGEKLSVRLSGLYELLPKDMQTTATALEKSMEELLTDFLGNVKLPSLSTAGNYVKNIADIILFSIIALLASYFFTADRDKILAILKNIVPESIQGYYKLIMENIKTAFGGYFKAQFKIMLILTLILFVGLELMQVHYSFFVALLIAFLDLLPVFGTGTILWPWIVIDLITGEYKSAIFLGVLYLICQVVKQLLQPKMVGDSIGISPLATLFFMFVGYRMGGVLGMIVGIPIGMAILKFYELGIFDRLIKGLKILIHDINEFRKY